MSVTAASFRANFPEFSSVATYPDPEVGFWLALAIQLVGPRWGGLADTGVQLFVAHNLSLQYDSNKAGTSGRKPGEVVGPVSSGSVDKVSYSRDPGAAMDPKNGHWNLSTYGLRYIRLVGMVGAGGVQVGAPLSGSNYGCGAWPGPWQSNFPNPS